MSFSGLLLLDVDLGKLDGISDTFSLNCKFLTFFEAVERDELTEVGDVGEDMDDDAEFSFEPNLNMEEIALTVD
jgi:hypothetical protein